MSFVWFITGASSGLGLELALAARKAEHRVIGTVRNKTKSADAVSKLESAGVKIVELDVSKGSAAVQEVAVQSEGIYGHIDVLVNNAGYSLLGAVEDFSEKEAHLQFETNFFGPLYLIQALLPGMRARKSGTIVNLSSSAGVDGLPSCGLYAGTKFALEGLSESLSREVAPFGIKVLIVQPGAFRTNFLGAFQSPEKGLTEGYKGTAVDEVISKFGAANGKQPGDPVKGAEIIVKTVTDGVTVDSESVSRLPLGKDCLARHQAKIESLQHDARVCKATAESAWFPGSG